MGEPLRKMHMIWGGKFAGSEEVSLLGSTAGEPVGISDPRFPGLGWALREDWPSLLYDKPDVAPSLLTGERLTPDLVERLWRPIRVELLGERALTREFPNKLPHWLVVSGVPVISARVMSIIEAIEPNRHQFFPVRMEAWDTADALFVDQKFGYLNVLNWVAPDLLYDLEAMAGAPGIESDTVRAVTDVEAAPEFAGPVKWTTISIQNYNFSTWLIRPDWVGAGHILSTGSYSKGRFTRISAANMVFISDELWTALKRELDREAFQSRPYSFSKR